MMSKTEKIKKEPLLQQPFSFYSCYFDMKLNEKADVVERDLVKYYKQEYEDAMYQVELRRGEVKGCEEVIRGHMKEEFRLNSIIENLEYKI